MPPAWLSAPVSLTRFQVSRHPPCFSKATLYYGAPLPSAGSARTAFPSVISTVRALRLPVPTTGSLIYSFPRCNFSPPRSLPCGGGIRRARSRSSRGTTSYMKLLEHRISQVPGESIPYLCPALRSRPVDTGLTFTACTVLSPLTRQQRHRQHDYIGTQSRGFSIRCLRFKSCVTARTCKTRFRPVVSLCRMGVEPAGLHRKVSVRYIELPPFPGLSWRDM
jgi:hypothetical protein